MVNPVLTSQPSTHPSSETGKVISHFRIGIEIGRGSFANVYKGIDLNDNNKKVAIKSIFRSRLKNQKLISNLKIEIKILSNLKNPHIVSLLDCVKTDNYFHLIMDYCSLGDLSYFIKKRNQLSNQHPIIKNVLEKYPSPINSNGLNEILVINFIKQLSSALFFLKSQNLIHRDIKPQNLLLCSPCNSKDEFIKNNFVGIWDLPILKVADFGFARYLPSTSMAETLCGSPLYMAPEILRYEKYSAKADLWSVGTVIYEMVVGKPPFRAQNHIELLKKIEKSNDEINFPTNFKISPDLIRLICSLLKANPIDRMGFNEFFNDPIITSNNFDDYDNDDDHNSIKKSINLNDDMYVSEYLNNNNNNNNQELTEVNKTDISKKDDESNNDSMAKSNNNTTNNNNNLKSGILNGVVTKENIENKIQTKNITDKNVENLLQEQKISIKPINNQFKKTNGKKFKNDLIVEKDYVVIEKRNVEVNKFADEIKDVSKPLKSERSSFSKQRRYSMSVSPSNALKDVLDYTTEKLFGVTNNNDHNNNDSNNNNSNNNKETENEDNEIKVDINKLLVNNNEKEEIKNKDKNEIETNFKEDENLVRKIENLAMMSHAISLFADSKFEQIIPLPPSIQTDNFNESNLFNNEFINKNKNSNTNKINEPEYILNYMKLCQEGLILYLRILSLLSKAIKISSKWLIKNKFKTNIIPRLGNLIQWIRNKFNESLEKGEYLKLRLNKFEEEIKVTINFNKLIFEKIIFDRAIEISKDTAIKELNYSTNVEELRKCEISYSVSVWMLESLLFNEDDEDDDEDDEEGVDEKENEEEVNEILDKGDRKIVENFINSIGTRLIILKNKIDRN